MWKTGSTESMDFTYLLIFVPQIINLVMQKGGLMMIRIAVVEDDKIYKEQIIEYLHRFEQEKGEKIKVDTFSDGDEFVSNYLVQFDIILMDVQMPMLDGMSAAEEIRKIDSEVVIIFITNLAQYAIKGYEVDALDYVLKPISYFPFSQRLKRAVDRMQNRESSFITIKAKDGVKRLKVSDIFYVESYKHDLIFFTKNEEFTVTGAMKDLEIQLAKFNFFRANKGYLINLEHVEGMEENCALVNGQKLIVSRNKRKPFMEALSNYWGEIIK